MIHISIFDTKVLLTNPEQIFHEHKKRNNTKKISISYETTKKKTASGGGAKRTMKPGKTKTISDLPQVSDVPHVNTRG